MECFMSQRLSREPRGEEDEDLWRSVRQVAFDLAAFEKRIHDEMDERFALLAAELRAESAAAASAAATAYWSIENANIEGWEAQVAAATAGGEPDTENLQPCREMQGLPERAWKHAACVPFSEGVAASDPTGSGNAQNVAHEATNLEDEAEMHTQTSPPQHRQPGGMNAPEGDADDGDEPREPEVEHIPPEESTELENSIWDAALFIGHASVGTCGSLMLAVLLVVNILCQSQFIGITYLVLSKSSFTDAQQEGLRLWRYNIGQSAKFYDKMTLSSLSERICKQTSQTYPVDMSDGKNDLISAMQLYLPGNTFPAKVFSGPVLCLMAMIYWSLSVGNELRVIWARYIAFQYVPQAHHTEIDGDGQVYRLTTWTRSRFLFAQSICFLRAVAAVSLWFFGSMFLVNYSINPADLILNAVALEVVLNVDEALYALVPTCTRNLLKSLEPLPGSRRVREYHGVDFRSAFLAALILLAAGLSGAFQIVPLIERVRNAYDTLCGGETEFVYALDPNMFVYQSPTNPFGVSMDSARNTPTSLAIEELIYPERVPKLAAGRLPMSWSWPMKGVGPVLAIMAMSGEEASAELQQLMGLSCGNVMENAPMIARFVHEASKFLGHNGVVQSCADVSQLCLDPSFPLVRSVCPVTCGCDNASAPLALLSADDGCPSACPQSTKYGTSLSNLECIEKDASALRDDHTWLSLAKQIGFKFDIIMQVYPAVGERICGRNCTDTFLQLGCGIVTHWSAASLVAGGSGFDICRGFYAGDNLVAKPLATLCPVSCNCRVREDLKDICPGGCNVRRLQV